MPPELPVPWAAFLAELDRALAAPVELHCVGGFVLAVLYALPRPTADVDYVSTVPSHQAEQVQRLGGPESALARKYGVHLQHVTVATVPEAYEGRLAEVFLGPLGPLRVLALAPYDLLLPKLERNSPKDRADVEYLARRLRLDPAVLRQRYRHELRPNLLARHEWHDQTLEMWIESYFR